MDLFISDICILKGKEYFLLHSKHYDLYQPESFGIEQDISIGDYPSRVYAIYEFTKKQLFLKELIYRKQTIANIMKVIEYTGELLLARTVVNGFQCDANHEDPIAFKTVLDVKLKDGRIVNVEDCSQRYEQRRRLSAQKHHGLCQA